VPHGDDDLLSLRKLADALNVDFHKIYRATQNYREGSIHPVPTPDIDAMVDGKRYVRYRRRRIAEWRRWLNDHPVRRKGPGPRRQDEAVDTSMQADLIAALQRSADTLAGTVASLRRLLPPADLAEVLAEIKTLNLYGPLGTVVASWVDTPMVRARWQRYPPRVRKELTPRARVHDPNTKKRWSRSARERNVARVLRTRRLPKHLAEVKAALLHIDRVLMTVTAVAAARTRESFETAMATYEPKPDDKDVPRILPPM